MAEPPKKPPKKKINKLWLIPLVVIVGLILDWGLSPIEGTILYGICKTYIEQNDQYPQNLEFLGAEEINEIVRLNYRSVDAFGMQTLNYVECKFREDKDYGVALASVDINREKKYPEEDPERVKKFNVSMPSLLANPPNLAYPPALPSDIKDYK